MPSFAERKTEYETHSTNGKDFYNDLRTQASLDVESGAITLKDAFERERILKEVKLDLCIGDFKTALNHINNTLPNVHVPQSYLDSLKADIQNYITNNYSW